MKFVSVHYFLLSLLLVVSPLSQGNVKFVSETGFIIENQVTVSRQAEDVWRALINDVDQWWPKDHTWWKGDLSIEPIAGGCFCEIKHDLSAAHMHISYVEPNKTLRMIGALGPLQEMGVSGALTWKFTPINDQVQLTLTYAVSGISPSGFEALAPIVDQVQATQLGALAEYVARQ